MNKPLFRLFLLCLAMSTAYGLSAAEKKKKRGKKRRGTRVEKVERSPDFDRLVKLNSKVLFGGTIQLSGDKVTITYKTADEMRTGFHGKGIFDKSSPEMSGSNGSFVTDNTVAAGMVNRKKRGFWVSRYPLQGETWLDIQFRIPNLLNKQSSFSAIVNFDKKKKSGYQTNFFQTISRLSRGQPKSTRRPKLKKFRANASNWIKRGEIVPMGFGIRDGGCVANGKLGQKVIEIVRMPKVKDRGGHVAFSYAKIVFTFEGLVVSGLIDVAWCQEELDRLRKEGKLLEEKIASEEDGTNDTNSSAEGDNKEEVEKGEDSEE